MTARIVLQQPLAFARVGSSRSSPVEAFRWTEPDLRPHEGTGRTSIIPPTQFRDGDSIRPVCPFFELCLDCDGELTPLTEDVLRKTYNKSLSDVTWSIRHANWKAFAFTRDEGDKIEACATVTGDNCTRRELIGYTHGGKQRLVPEKPGIPMGAIQVMAPNPSEALRLRFFPPEGLAYGPEDLERRLARSPSIIDRIVRLVPGVNNDSDWKKFYLPKSRLILNPGAAWPKSSLLSYGCLWADRWRILLKLPSAVSLFRCHAQRSERVRFLLGPTVDAHALPPGLFAYRGGSDGAVLSCLGFVDDLGDGIITCKIDGVDGEAKARIVVTPPHFAPDRRPVVSIADVLTDRTRRDEVRRSDWLDSPAKWASAQHETFDLLDRAYETAGLTNLDTSNDELAAENTSDAVYRGDRKPPKHPDKLLWRDTGNETVVDLPLTEGGRRRHRRNTAQEFFEQLVRDFPHLMEKWIRDPSDDESLYYDKRMPALMRGSDRRPLHLTRRQLGALRAWAKKLI